MSNFLETRPLVDGDAVPAPPPAIEANPDWGFVPARGGWLLALALGCWLLATMAFRSYQRSV